MPGPDGQADTQVTIIPVFKETRRQIACFRQSHELRRWRSDPETSGAIRLGGTASYDQCDVVRLFPVPELLYRPNDHIDKGCGSIVEMCSQGIN